MEPKWDSPKNRGQNRQPHPLALSLPLTYSASCPQIPELEPRNALECATLSGQSWSGVSEEGGLARGWVNALCIYLFIFRLSFPSSASSSPEFRCLAWSRPLSRLALPVPPIISLPIARSLGHFVGPSLPSSSSLLRFSRACKISANLQTFFRLSISYSFSTSLWVFGKGCSRLIARWATLKTLGKSALFTSFIYSRVHLCVDLCCYDF